MDLLRHTNRPSRQARDIPLQRIHKHLDITLQLLRREPQLPNRQPNHRISLPVLARANHRLQRVLDVVDHRPRLRRRHQSLGTENSSQRSLVHLLEAVDVAHAAFEIDDALLDLREDIVLADEPGACLAGIGCGLGVRGCDHADAEIGLDGFREAQAVADGGPVLERAEADVEFVL